MNQKFFVFSFFKMRQYTLAFCILPVSTTKSYWSLILSIECQDFVHCHKTKNSICVRISQPPGENTCLWIWQSTKKICVDICLLLVKFLSKLNSQILWIYDRTIQKLKLSWVNPLPSLNYLKRILYQTVLEMLP